jgi:hypothetical protein
MAVAYVQEFAIGDRSTANYDFMKENVTSGGAIDGLIVHTAGFDDEDGVFRIMDVWESREQADRFLAERIQPIIDKGPEAFPAPTKFTPPAREGFYELHSVVK